LSPDATREGFAGGLAGLDHGAAKVIGIDKEKKHLRTARRRIEEG
jgi:hypothetical protein